VSTPYDFPDANSSKITIKKVEKPHFAQKSLHKNSRKIESFCLELQKWGNWCIKLKMFTNRGFATTNNWCFWSKRLVHKVGYHKTKENRTIFVRSK